MVSEDTPGRSLLYHREFPGVRRVFPMEILCGETRQGTALEGRTGVDLCICRTAYAFGLTGSGFQDRERDYYLSSVLITALLTRLVSSSTVNLSLVFAKNPLLCAKDTRISSEISVRSTGVPS